VPSRRRADRRRRRHCPVRRPHPGSPVVRRPGDHVAAARSRPRPVADGDGDGESGAHRGVGRPSPPRPVTTTRPGRPGSPRGSRPTACGTHSSPPLSTPASPCAMCRKRPATSTRAPPCVLTGHVDHSTGTPSTSWPRSSLALLADRSVIGHSYGSVAPEVVRWVRRRSASLSSGRPGAWCGTNGLAERSPVRLGCAPALCRWTGDRMSAERWYLSTARLVGGPAQGKAARVGKDTTGARCRVLSSEPRTGLPPLAGSEAPPLLSRNRHRSKPQRPRS
jgi:hypothetical protein